jgi:hypothetical protein
MSDIFACGECRAVYTIIRLLEPPIAPPHCEVCGNKFPPRELGEWLAYQHAEPEWNVKAWLTDTQHVESQLTDAQHVESQLTDAQHVESHMSQDDQPENSDQPLVDHEDQPAVIRTKVLTTLTGGVRKIAALITRD